MDPTMGFLELNSSPYYLASNSGFGFYLSQPSYTFQIELDTSQLPELSSMFPLLCSSSCNILFWHSHSFLLKSPPTLEGSKTFPDAVLCDIISLPPRHDLPFLLNPWHLKHASRVGF